MKLKDVFDITTDCYIDIHKVNPKSELDPFVLYDSLFSTEEDLETILKTYSKFPVINITCYDEGPTVVITIDDFKNHRT